MMVATPPHLLWMQFHCFKAGGEAGGGGGGGKHYLFSFHICDGAAEDEQVEKTGSKSDCAFLRYCTPMSEVYL